MAFPFFFIILPIIACIVYTVLSRRYVDPRMTQAGFTLIELYAVSSALATLFLIAPYREHFFKLIGFRQKSTKITINPVVTMHANPTAVIKPINVKIIKVYRHRQVIRTIT